MANAVTRVIMRCEEARENESLGKSLEFGESDRSRATLRFSYSRLKFIEEVINPRRIRREIVGVLTCFRNLLRIGAQSSSSYYENTSGLVQYSRVSI